MKNDIRKVLREYWDDQPDKWGLLEMDVRGFTDKIIERHKDNWGGDQYTLLIQYNKYLKVCRKSTN